jgi:hypothetical protein
VRTVKTGDSANWLARGRIKDIDACAVGEVKAVRAGVGKQVIPAAIATNLPFVDDFVRLLCGKLAGTYNQTAKESSGNG